ncbi:superoxide dismutase [bacterium]|nr:superoxide dismutase [bacterium]
MNRRTFIGTAAAGMAAAGGLPQMLHAAEMETAKFVLPSLPWAPNALEPFISEKTVGFHYGKHHKGYVDKTNKLIQNTSYQSMPLPEIIRKSAGKPQDQNIFNNAAQVWNHAFFWHSMKPGGGGKPGGKIAEGVRIAFGDYDAFRERFIATATGRFGSGWAWLVERNGLLAILSTPNAENPVALGLKPLLALDVWEHAYYLDYQNRREDFAKTWLDNLVNWEFAEKNLSQMNPAEKVV